MVDAEPPGSLSGRQLPCLPCPFPCLELVGAFHRLRAEFYATSFRRRDALSGAPLVHFPLHLGNVGENLDDEVQDQLCRKVISVLVSGIKDGHVCLCQVETKNFFLCRELSPGPAPRPMAEMMPQIFSDTLLPRLGREQDVFPFGQLDLALHILKTPIRLHQGSHETAIALQSAHRDKPESYPQRHVPCHRSGIFPRGIPRTRPQMQCA